MLSSYCHHFGLSPSDLMIKIMIKKQLHIMRTIFDNNHQGGNTGEVEVEARGEGKGKGKEIKAGAKHRVTQG